MGTVLESEIGKNGFLQDDEKNDLSFENIFADWNTDSVSSKISLLDKFISDVKEQLFGKKELSSAYELSLIDLLEKFNRAKERLQDSGITEFSNHISEEKDGTDAWRLHKKFQSTVSMKAK
jgi:hypothetical protein